jgi:hypothetical protein
MGDIYLPILSNIDKKSVSKITKEIAGINITDPKTVSIRRNLVRVTHPQYPYIYSAPPFSHMVDSQTSFWTPARIAVVIGIVLLVVLLAYAASLPRRGAFDARKANL